jgi:SnoaL-like domain
VSSNHDRATTLVRALHAGVEGDPQTLRVILTDDVRAWTPTLATSSLDGLLAELDHRGDPFSDLTLETSPLDVGGEFACVEWTAEMTHTGPLRVNDELLVEPSGIRVAIHGVTVAEFDGDRICSLRQYWDEIAVLEQLGITRRADPIVAVDGA